MQVRANRPDEAADVADLQPIVALGGLTRRDLQAIVISLEASQRDVARSIRNAERKGKDPAVAEKLRQKGEQLYAITTKVLELSEELRRRSAARARKRQKLRRATEGKGELALDVWNFKVVAHSLRKRVAEDGYEMEPDVLADVLMARSVLNGMIRDHKATVGLLPSAEEEE